MEELLNISGLRTYFFTEAGVVKAVDGITFNVSKGETLGLVGESGSGKSVTALSALRIVPRPGRIIGGKVTFEGRDLLPLDEEEMRKLRGAKMAMVFQDPLTSLNPMMSGGWQLAEALRLHDRSITRRQARARGGDALRLVGFPEPSRILDAYAHELS
ncbi:MAG: ABC transporter ATP-binding protein, partial [Nitrososphaerota archaeon]|nr:ABC transporter ATP-binding protein [Nitrososphaerota archaeon]